MPESKEIFTQHRRWLKTRFTFGRKQLDYSVTSKQDANLQQQVGWDTIGPRSSYMSMVEPDRDLRWTLFVLSGLALFAAFRSNAHPFLVLGIYAGVTLTVVAVLLLTRRLRSVAYTALPAGEINVLVLADRQHDTIIERIEARRADALTQKLTAEGDVPLRIYLRRLRWLVENGVITRDAYMHRQTALLPRETRSFLQDEPPAEPVQTFSQRGLAARVDITLEPSRVIFRRWTLLGGSEEFPVDYRNLREPLVQEEIDKQFELTAILIAWAGTIVVAWGGFITGSHPANYYVGGIGLQRALVDFGPLLLAAIGAAALIPWLTQLKVGRPWPGVVLIRDRQYETIVNAIAERRLAALRALARPDPLLQPQEQVQLLDDLHDSGVLDDDEHARAVELAELAFGDPALDEPVQTDAAASRDRVLH